MKFCFFGRKPPSEVEFLLRVLDCSDVLELAELYGEARDGFRNASLMKAVDDRMSEVLRPAASPPSTAKAGEPEVRALTPLLETKE